MRPLYALFLVVVLPLFARAEADYVKAANALQSMSDEDFAAQFKDAGVGRYEALGGVYQRLAQAQYEKSKEAAADEARKAALDAELNRLRPAIAEGEKTGYWSNLWQGLQESSADSHYRYRGPAAVAAVRGGRELKSDADRKLFALAQQQETLLKNLADTGSDKCALYQESGKIYEQMAATAKGGAPAPRDEAASLRKAADRVLKMSDEEYDSRIRTLGDKPLPPRLAALSNLYTRLAKIQYEKARATAADDKRRQAELDAALELLRPRAAAAEKAGWLSSFSNYLNYEPVRHSDVEAAVTSVRGGRELKSDADRRLAALSQEQDGILKELTQGHDEAELYQKSGKLYDEMAAAAGAAVPAAAKDASPAAGTAAPSVTLTPRDIYQRVSPGVVFVFGAAESGGEIGTGSVIDPSHVLTNAHVVIRASSGEPWPSIRVYLKPAKITGDNKRDLQNPISAKVARYDRELDLAVLELQDAPSGLTAVYLGDSSSVSPGDPVVAIGHPEQGGLWTLTQGVIGTVLANFEKVQGKDVFQTDASINRGNSGGPLLSRDGSMIGVNTAMSRRAADGMAITAVNFSVQSNVVKNWLAGSDVKLAAAAPAPAPAAPRADAGLVTIAEAPKPVEAPKPAPAPARPSKPVAGTTAPAVEILTPAKPYKVEDLIQQEMAEMEDLSKEMEQEVQRVRSRQ